MESGSSPPTEPPPAPPPLNLPPSRARRQLAARLALHREQKAEAEASATKDETDDLTEEAFGGTNETREGNGHWDSDDATSDHTDDDYSTEQKFGLDVTGSLSKEEEKKRPGVRQLDLDDFANSPAADADETGSNDSSGEDIEMRVALG